MRIITTPAYTIGLTVLASGAFVLFVVAWFLATLAGMR